MADGPMVRGRAMTMTLTLKERVHQLVDGLRDEDLLVAERVLRELIQPPAESLVSFLESCPVDDEEETEDERERVRRAWEAVDRGEVLSHEQVVRCARERRRGLSE